MWGQRFRFSTALYIGCRYALVANVLYLLAIGNKLGSTVRAFESISSGMTDFAHRLYLARSALIPLDLGFEFDASFSGVTFGTR